MNEKTINVNAGINIAPMVAAQLTNAYFSALALKVQPGQAVTDEIAQQASDEVFARWREYYKFLKTFWE